MDDETRKKLEERKKDSPSAKGDRMQSGSPSSGPNPVDHLEHYLDEVHDGDRSRSVSFYDPSMAAIFGYLEEDDQRLTEIVAKAQADLNREVNRDEADRAELIRVVLRVGFQNLDDDLLEETADASQRRVNREARQI